MISIEKTNRNCPSCPIFMDSEIGELMKNYQEVIEILKVVHPMLRGIYMSLPYDPVRENSQLVHTMKRCRKALVDAGCYEPDEGDKV